jgi:pimeloyl-ACP methyl ester carboxylesterase
MLARCACLVVVVASLALPAVAEAQTGDGFEPSPLRHVRVGDISVGYRTIGSGPPLVLITGYAATLYVWDPGLLTRLAERRRVIVFDNRGVLTTTRGRGRLTIQRMADDTAGLIHALGYRRADAMGWSMGGNIAQELALRHPGRVRRLVLAATDPGSPRAIQPTDQLARRILSDPNPTIQELLRAIFPATKQAAANAYVQRLLLWPGVQPSDFNASPQITREQSVAEGRRLWFCRTCGAYGRLPSLRASTLVADGRRDIIEPPGNSRIIARRIPRALLTLYGAAGHAFLFQRRAAFATRVNSFLE